MIAPDTMLERMASALAKYEWNRMAPIAQQNYTSYQAFLNEGHADPDKAHAALECLLEPTEGMVDAFAFAFDQAARHARVPDGSDPPLRMRKQMGVTAGFQAMIRAAMEGK